MTKKTDDAVETGRLYEIRAELASKRKGPYVLTEDISIAPPTFKTIKKLRTAKDDEQRLAIILGDDKDAIEALFDDRPFDEWLEFQKDLFEHLYGKGVLALPGGSQGS